MSDLSDAAEAVRQIIDDHQILLEERRELLTAVSDLLHFQTDALDVLSTCASGQRVAQELIERYRKSTPAISKVRVKALAFTTQHELPLVEK